MSTDPMAGLISTVNKLQDAFTLLGYDPLSLPQICVVGGQSSGKSSVMENIVGRDFLPRGSGIVTRRPLIIQLVNDPEQKEDVGEFLHKPGGKYTDYEAMKHEIEAATDEETGTNKGISNKPINLRITSARVLNLTLVDLPGMTRVAVGDQPADIGQQIEEMVMHFISQPKAIILAVTPANTDLANSDALRVARKVDPDGHRTIGVITKCDIMDRGTNAMDILENKAVPLRHGYIAVVNRAQEDIDKGKKIDSQWDAEKSYFKEHPQYRRISERCGTEYLTKMLNKTLTGHIRSSLPDIMAKIELFMKEKEEELKSLTELDDLSSMQKQVLRSLSQYADEFKEVINGDGTEISGEALAGGARMSYIFRQTFAKALHNLDVLDGVTRDEIRTTIRNSKGLSGGLFIPEKGFEAIIRRLIKGLGVPAQQCVRMVFDELISIANNIETEVMKRFAPMRNATQDAARDLLHSLLPITVDLVDTIISMEVVRINTHHPDFISSRKKAKALVAGASKDGKRNAASRKAAKENTETPLAEEGAEAPDGGEEGEEDPAAAPRKAAPPPPGGKPQLPPARPSKRPSIRRSRPEAPRRRESKDKFNLDTLKDNEMEETEDMDVEMIRRLLEDYFRIIATKVADSVPKAIVLKLIQKSEDEMHDHLVAALYKEDLFSELLEESEETVQRRASCREILKLLKSSCAAIHQVQKDSGLLRG